MPFWCLEKIDRTPSLDADPSERRRSTVDASFSHGQLPLHPLASSPQAIGLSVTLDQPYVKDTTAYWKDWPLQFHPCVGPRRQESVSPNAPPIPAPRLCVGGGAQTRQHALWPQTAAPRACCADRRLTHHTPPLLLQGWDPLLLLCRDRPLPVRDDRSAGASVAVGRGSSFFSAWTKAATAVYRHEQRTDFQKETLARCLRPAGVGDAEEGLRGDGCSPHRHHGAPGRFLPLGFPEGASASKRRQMIAPRVVVIRRRIRSAPDTFFLPLRCASPTRSGRSSCFCTTCATSGWRRRSSRNTPAPRCALLRASPLPPPHL